MHESQNLIAELRVLRAKIGHVLDRLEVNQVSTLAIEDLHHRSARIAAELDLLIDALANSERKASL
jgi:hypothetical protein